MEAISHAGTCLGILAKDGVLLAAERRNTNKLLDDVCSDKIYKLHGDAACSVAGITSDANVLTQQLRLTAERYHLLYQEPMPMEQLVCNLCDLKQRYTQVGGYRPFGVSLLYMGWDHRLGFQLYQSDPSGNYSGWKATCIGNNSMAAISMLKQDYNEDGISLDEALKLAVKVLSKSLDLQSLTSEKVEIAHLTRKDDKTVIHILTSDEVDQLLKEHEEAEKKAEAEKLKAEKQKAAKK